MAWFRSNKESSSSPAQAPGSSASASASASSSGSASAAADKDADASVEEDAPTAIAQRPVPTGDGASRIAPDTVIKGSVTTASPLVVAGVVEGGVKSSSNVSVLAEAQVQGPIAGGKVDVHLGGTVDGSVSARDVENAGEIKGGVSATGRLVIRSSGGVAGDVSVGSLIVEEGGTLRGGCRMGKA